MWPGERIPESNLNSLGTYYIKWKSICHSFMASTFVIKQSIFWHLSTLNTFFSFNDFSVGKNKPYIKPTFKRQDRFWLLQ